MDVKLISLAVAIEFLYAYVLLLPQSSAQSLPPIQSSLQELGTEWEKKFESFLSDNISDSGFEISNWCGTVLNYSAGCFEIGTQTGGRAFLASTEDGNYYLENLVSSTYVAS